MPPFQPCIAARKARHRATVRSTRAAHHRPNSTLTLRVHDGLIESEDTNIMKLLRITRIALPLGLIAIALTGCAVIPPTGPSVVALPPSGKPIGVFQQEDYACRDYAFRSDNAAAPAHSEIPDGVGSTAIGTVGGAAAGALLGAAAGRRGRRRSDRCGRGSAVWRCRRCKRRASHLGRSAGAVQRSLRAMHGLKGQQYFSTGRLYDGAGLRSAPVAASRPRRLRLPVTLRLLGLTRFPAAHFLLALPRDDAAMDHEQRKPAVVA